MNAQRWRPLVQALAGIAAAALIAVILESLASTNSLVAATRQQQKGNATTIASTQLAAKQAARTSRLIKSCVTPAGKCFKDGQARTGEAIGTINASVVASAACAASIVQTTPGLSPPELTNRITACVHAVLASQR